MQTMPGRPRGSTRLARALGLDGNPLRRLTRAFLTRRRLKAWETAWSTVGSQWSRGSS
jgi:hypothetical protein